MRKVAVIGAAVLIASVAWQQAEAAVILNQVQTFDDPHGWVTGVGPGGGSPAGVPVVPGGGPGGATDPFLSIVSSGGNGPGSRLSAQNFSEWADNYLAAGIGAIEMDVRNFGTTDLSLRLLFVDFDGVAPVNAAISDVILVRASSDWSTIQFDVAPGSLSALIGSSIGALSDVDELRLVHSPTALFVPGSVPAIAGNLGVDNIRATASAPEPATWMLLGLALYGARRHRRRKP